MQVQKWQELRDLRRAAHVGWHDQAPEARTFSMLVDPAVVYPGDTDLHGLSPTEDLALPGTPLANEQGASVLVALQPGCLDVGLDLCFECLAEHATRSVADDLIEIERKVFTGCLILV